MANILTYKIKKDIPEEEIPRITKETFNLLKEIYGYNLKITNFPELLRKATGMKLEGINYQEDWTPQFISYLIDLQHKFMDGGELDMVVFHQDIIKVFHPSKIEKQLLVKSNIEDRLWAIFLAVSNPNHEKFKLNYD